MMQLPVEYITKSTSLKIYIIVANNENVTFIRMERYETDSRVGR